MVMTSAAAGESVMGDGGSKPAAARSAKIVLAVEAKIILVK